MNPSPQPHHTRASAGPGRAADHIRRRVERLPVQSPSFVLACLLDRVPLPRLPADARTALSGRTVKAVVSDLGLRVRLQCGSGGGRQAHQIGTTHRGASTQ